MDGGGSPELGLYMSRSEILGKAVIGPEFYQLIHQAGQIQQDTKLEEVEALYSRAFDLLHDACARVQRQRAEYDRLVEWRNEATLHGTGHPSLKDALLEAYHELWDFIPWPSPKETEATEAEGFKRRLELRGEDIWMLISSLPQ